MKQKLFILIIYFLLSLSTIIETKGQCIADAGNDTAFCVNNGLDTFLLGGNPTASGGIGNYTYIWETYKTYGPPGFSITFTASDYLDDTTLANPQLIGSADSSLTFHLTVIDSIGNTCTDSMILLFSQYIWTLDDKIAFINQGDSVQLYKSIYGGFPPITYLWSPSTGLTDPTYVYTWAKPDTTTFYSLLTTDSIGCQGGDGFSVYVGTMGLADRNKMETKIKIIPHPLTDLSIIKTFKYEGNELTLEFYDVLGRKTYHIETRETEINLRKRDFEGGIYFYRLIENEKTVGQGKLIVE